MHMCMHSRSEWPTLHPTESLLVSLSPAAFVLLRVLVPVVAHKLENQGHCPLQLCAVSSAKLYDVLKPHSMEVQLRFRTHVCICGTCPAPLVSRETGRGEAMPAPCTGCSQVDSCMWTEVLHCYTTRQLKFRLCRHMLCKICLS